MNSLDQINKDYADIMHGFQFNPIFNDPADMSPHVYYEEFSVFDKSLKSKSFASIK